MNYLRPLLRHLRYFRIRNFVQNGCIFNNAGVGGHNAFHIGINFNFFGIKRHTKCSRRNIAAAASKRGKFAVVFRHALKTADNGNHAGFQQMLQIVRFNIFNACRTKLGIGYNTSLPAG